MEPCGGSSRGIRITRKKKTGHATEQEREDVEAPAKTGSRGQLDLDSSKLVFIDESVLQRHGRSSL